MDVKQWAAASSALAKILKNQCPNTFIKHKVTIESTFEHAHAR
jgi:hypothetical protein